MKRTDQEIKAEIAALKELKPKIRRINLFGDDNYAAIEAQIRELEAPGTYDDTAPYYDNLREHIRDCIDQVKRWLEGDDETASAEWEILKK